MPFAIFFKILLNNLNYKIFNIINKLYIYRRKKIRISYTNIYYKPVEPNLPWFTRSSIIMDSIIKRVFHFTFVFGFVQYQLVCMSEHVIFSMKKKSFECLD